MPIIGPYRRKWTYRTLGLILLAVFLFWAWGRFEPVKQEGLSAMLGRKPFAMPDLPAGVSAWLAEKGPDGRPLAESVMDGWGSSLFPAADIPKGAFPPGPGWNVLARMLEKLDTADPQYEKARLIGNSFLPIPSPERLDQFEEPSPHSCEQRILYGLIRYHQGVACLKLADANGIQPLTRDGFIAQAVLVLRRSLKHFQSLNRNGLDCGGLLGEGVAWDGMVLPPRYGSFPIRHVYAALGVACLRARSFGPGAYPRPDMDYMTEQRNTYGNDTARLSACAVGYIDQCLQAPAEAGKSPQYASLWRLSMGLSNVGLGARNLAEDAVDPILHYTAGILLMALADRTSDSARRNQAWERAGWEFSCAMGQCPDEGDRQAEGSSDGAAGDAGSADGGDAKGEAAGGGRYADAADGGDHSADAAGAGGAAPDEAAAVETLALKALVLTGFLSKHGDKAWEKARSSFSADSFHDPLDGPDKGYGGLVGDLAVAAHLARGEFDKASAMVDRRRKELAGLGDVSGAFERLLSVTARAFLADLGSDISSKNAVAWNEVYGLLEKNDWLKKEGRALAKAPGVWRARAEAAVSGHRWIVTLILFVFYVGFVGVIFLLDSRREKRVLGNAYAQDLGPPPTSGRYAKALHQEGKREDDEYIDA